MARSMGWHFAPNNGKLRYGDNRRIATGETLSVEGTPKLCEFGMHHSARIIDALQYSPGSVICRTELLGDVIHGDDKSVSLSRRTHWILDARRGEAVLRHFARVCAFGETEKWQAPHIVLRYLPTGNENIWDVARAASRDAAWAAAWAASWASRDAAWAAAWAAQNRLLESLCVKMHKTGRLPQPRLTASRRAKYPDFVL